MLMTDEEKYRAVELAAAIYERHPAGCCWHIVLDDGNYKDSDVKACRRWAAQAKHADCKELGPLLARMSRSQRNKVSRGLYAGMVRAMDEKKSKALWDSIPMATPEEIAAAERRPHGK